MLDQIGRAFDVLIGAFYGGLLAMTMILLKAGGAVLGRLSVMSMVEVALTALAVIGALVGFGAINRMDHRTEKAIIFSFITTCTGLIGYGVGTVFPGKWSLPCDLLLLGGVGAMMIGSRRRTIWMRPERMPALAVAVAVAAWVAFFAGIS